MTVLDHDRALRKKSTKLPPLDSWTEKDHKCIKDLQDTFSVLEGYGLAAPQIGIFKRVIIVNFQALGLEGESATEIIINPKIETYGEIQRNEEACFSVPHISARVKRPMSCRVEYTSISGKPKTIELSGFPSACLQHEIDHLDGRLYIDTVSPMWRSMLVKKVQKIEKKISATKSALKEEFEKEHRELQGERKEKKTGYSKKRKPSPRKKRVKKSKKNKR